MIGKLLSILSSDNFGKQHSLEFIFLIEFNPLDLFVISTALSINNGVITDTTGIRHQEIDDIPNPIIIAINVGIAPKNAFLLFTCLHVIYCEPKLIDEAIINPIIGNPIHNNKLKLDIEFLNSNKIIVRIKIKIPAGIAIDKLFILLLLSGLDIIS